MQKKKTARELPPVGAGRPRVSGTGACLPTALRGGVRVEFVIEKDGSVSRVRVVESPDRLLSDAATAVIEKSPVWEPGRQRNKPVRVKFNIPVDFRITDR